MMRFLAFGLMETHGLLSQRLPKVLSDRQQNVGSGTKAGHGWLLKELKTA